MSTTLATTLSRASAIIILLTLAIFTSYHVFAEDSTSGATTRRAVVQQKLDSRKTNIAQRIDTRIDNVENRIATMRERIASKGAELRKRLDAFKDKRKAAIAERVNTNLNQINQNRTQQMLKHLDKMTAILDKLENRVNQGTPDIKDPALARSAIASARSSIASASAAVTAQEQKDYTITVTNETVIRADAMTERNKLHTDLLAVRKLVIDAKQAVANAIRVAKSGRILPKEGTPSGE